MALNFNLQDLKNKYLGMLSGAGKTLSTLSNSYVQNVAKPMAVGTSLVRQIPQVAIGFGGEAKGLLRGQYGGQNFAPQPQVKFQPKNKAQELGSSLFNAQREFVGYGPAVGTGVENVGSAAVRTAKVNPVTGPAIARTEQFLSKIPEFFKKKLPANKLVSHEGAPDLKTVAKYKADIKAGRPVEPIKVIREGNKFGIEDGKHRFQAYKELGIKDIPVEVVPPRVPTKVGSPVVQGPTIVKPPKIVSPVEVKPTVGGGQVSGAGSPPSSTSIPDQDLIGKLTQALKEAKPLRGTQEQLYSKARGEKLAKLMSAREKMAGEKGFFQELGALKGDLPKVQYETIRNQFDQPSVDRLFTMITQNKYLGEWEKVNAQVGLAKILGQKGGGVPTKGEIQLLNTVYGSDFTETLLSKRSVMERMGDLGMQLYNIPRSFMAGVADFSGTLMQNMLFAYRHPLTTAKNFTQQLKMFASEDAFRMSGDEIASRPTWQAMKNAKVAITDVGPLTTQREEVFMSSLAEKIPGFGKLVRATGRAYTGFLNRMRADVFDQLYNSAKTTGVDVNDQAFLRSLGSFINNATGRGSLGKFEGSANLLSQGLFSARKLVASAQMINPVWYVKADPFVRKEALKTMAAFVGGGMTIVSLADLIPGVEVSKDPTNADFGKIKVGNTRFNVFGTYQQLAVLMGRLWKGYATSSTTGKKMMLGDEGNPYAPTRLDLLTRFFESKEHPTLSLIASAMRGQNSIGQPFDLAPETLNRFIPMMLADGYDLYKEHGPVGLLGLIPAILGIPTQTYGSQVPTIKTTPTGKQTVKLNPVGGIAEDVVRSVRGEPVSNIPQGEWKGIIDAKQKENKEDIIKDQVKTSGTAQTANGKVFYFDTESGTSKTLDLNPIAKPKLTGKTELDKLKISAYNSKITAQIKAYAKLEELGQISAEEAEKKINELTKVKIAKAKKGKKISIKKVKVPKIKLAKVKKIKIPKPKKVKKYALKKVKLKTAKLKRSASLT